MARLRTLLGTVDTKRVGVNSGGIGRLRGGETTYFSAHWGGASDASSTVSAGCHNKDTCGGICNYNAYFYCCWRVPGYPGAGTTAVTFELWGGGGGGAGACCCSMATPAGAGAYARKTLIGIASGTAFDLFIAPPTERCHCCYNEYAPGLVGGTMHCIGPRGCKTYVVQTTNLTGVALTNFCAEGGHGGKAGCFAGEWEGFVCHFRTGLTTMSGYCTNLGVGGYVSAASSFKQGFGGHSDVVGLNTSCVGCCAMFYGADYGAPGLPGAIMYTCIDSESFCANKAWIPYPGGLVNEQGGYLLHQGLHCTTCGFCMQCQSAAMVGFGGQCSDYGGYTPGMPAGPTVANAGGCCCGGWGNAGAIRITVTYL